MLCRAGASSAPPTLSAQPARTQGHENAQQHDRCGEHADAAQHQQHGADRFGRDAGDAAVGIADRCDPLRQILQQLRVHLRLRDGLARGVRQRREPQHGHAAVHDGTVEHIDDLLRAAVAKRLVARTERLVEPEAFDHVAGVPVERVPIRKDTAGLVPVFNEHERAAAFAQRVEHLRLRQRLRVGVDAGLSGGGKRVIPRGKEICAALCKAAGLRRAQPRILRGAHDVRIGKLCRRDQQLTRTGIRQLRQPVLHRDAGCVRERTDVLVADDHVDLPLRLLNTDPDAEQPEGRQRAQRCRDQK